MHSIRNPKLLDSYFSCLRLKKFIDNQKYLDKYIDLLIKQINIQEMDENMSDIHNFLEIEDVMESNIY